MDITGFWMHNALMLRLILIALLVLSANPLLAQQPAATSPKSKTIEASPGARPSDSASMAAAIRDSYYHPDGISGLDCAVSVDWPAFFSALKLNPAADRLKAIQSLNIRSQAARGKSANVTFEWKGGALDGKDQLEAGLKQMLDGFYQMYWSMVASSPINKAAEIAKTEPLPGGGTKVYVSSQNTNVVMTVDKESIPTHYTLDNPALNGTIDLHYIPSPKPVPGDLRRISALDVSEHIGTSVFNVRLALDYQTVDGFHVPGHVSYNLVGAYSLSMDFSGCSVSKEAGVDKVN